MVYVLFGSHLSYQKPIHKHGFGNHLLRGYYVQSRVPDTVGDSEMPIFIFQEQRKGRTGSIEERGQINDGQELGGFLREGSLAGVGLRGSR